MLYADIRKYVLTTTAIAVVTFQLSTGTEARGRGISLGIGGGSIGASVGGTGLSIGGGGITGSGALSGVSGIGSSVGGVVSGIGALDTKSGPGAGSASGLYFSGSNFFSGGAKCD